MPKDGLLPSTGRDNNGGFPGTGSVTCVNTAGDRYSFAAVRNINSQESGDENSSELRDIVDQIYSKVSKWPHLIYFSQMHGRLVAVQGRWGFIYFDLRDVYKVVRSVL